MPKKMTTKEFIERAIKIHGNKYDYSLVKYVRGNDKIEIICPIHGVFFQTAKIHMRGFGCSKCSGLSKMTTEDFIKKSQSIHGDKYDYSKTIYKKNGDFLIIICPKHGEFTQKANWHISGNGCPACSKTKKRTNLDFIEESVKIHGKKYNYSITNYKSAHKKVDIICKEHGAFSQEPNSHLKGIGCPICSFSHGEKIIMDVLIKNGMRFVPQFVFEKCKNIKNLPFDFYLKQTNTCIEFHGVQHFQPVKFFGGNNSFLMVKKRDRIKENYCKTEKIPLLIFWKSKLNIYSFVDIFSNCDKKTKDIFILNNFSEEDVCSYEKFKSSF